MGVKNREVSAGVGGPQLVRIGSLVAAAEAAERAWDRAPELDVDAILAKAKADAEAAANGANGAAH